MLVLCVRKPLLYPAELRDRETALERAARDALTE